MLLGLPPSQTPSGKAISVAGRRWDSNSATRALAVPGQTIEAILTDAVANMRRSGADRAYARRMLRYCRCRVNGIEIPREDWSTVCPPEGSRLEFLLAPKGGGGGGGKNPLAMILSVVVSVVAIAATAWIPGLNIFAAGGALAGWGAVAGGLAGAGIMLLGGLAVNALFPTARPSLGSGSVNDRQKESQTYTISGARNAANQYGFVPLILGRHKVTPPLAAKSWTVWEGDKQFFNMLVCWGHPDIEVSEFRIGETALENFKNVDHAFHQASTGDDLKYFAKSYNENSVGAVLKQSEGWTTRTVGEAEDISIDIAFQRGLTNINQETGANQWRTVTFQAQYKKKEDEEWANVVAGNRVEIHGMTQTVSGGFFRRPNVYSDWNGNISIGHGIGGDIQIYPSKNPYVTGCDVNLDYGDGTVRVSVSDGVFDNQGIIEISGAQTKALVKNFRIEGVERATYEVRIKRLTGDTSSQYIMDEATWSTMRAILNQPAFNTPIPICVSELRIQSSEQLSSYVDDFNAICHSKIPDYDAESGQWVTRTTTNPASCLRYMLTSRHGLNSPFTEEKMDDAALIEWHTFCAEEGFAFNFVCDTEETLWNRLTQIAAAGRAGVTCDNDGLYGVAIDRKGLEPVQIFTPRNSWGLNISRDFFKLPHALRVKFVNEDNEFNQDEGFVYADGYDKTTATDIVEWDFPGKTNWKEIWRHGRYYLARTKLRPISISLSTDWEWRLCRRGDLVGVASDVLMNVFGTARVQRLAYEVDDGLLWVGRQAEIPLDDEGLPLIPVGVELDDSIEFSNPAPARYGMSVRNSVGRPIVYEIQPQYGETSARLLFSNPITRAQIPPLQGLATVSILGDEYAEYLVANITPGDNASADLTLIPYAPEIMDADQGEIPPWEPPIHLDVVSGKKLPTPTITQVRSDESVLIRSASGGTIPRIAAWWKMDFGTGISGLTFQIQATSQDTGESVYGFSQGGEDFIAVQGVTEGEVYVVRIRAINPAGLTSDWSTPIRHKVIGRTTPPPAPSGVFLNGYSIRIEQLNRPLDVVGHKVFMAMDEDDDISMSLELTNPYTTTGTFDLTPFAGRARAIFVRTVDDLGLLSDPVRIVVNLGDVLPDNVLFEFSERKRGWSGEITGGYVAGDTLFADENAYLWPQSDDAPLWPQDDSLPLWPSGTAETLVYMWQVDIPAGYAGARVLVLPNAISGRLQRLEFRHYKEPYLWPQDDNAYLWPQDDNAYLWPQPEVSEWDVMPDDYVTPGGETLEFRAVYANTEQAQLLDIVTVLDVKDKEFSLEDVAVAADGQTRIDIPDDYFRAITNVVFGLQYNQGSSAVSVQRVRGSEIMGSNGYLTDGPLIRALTSAGALTSANCDIRIKGY